VEGYWKKVKQGSEFDNENTKEKYVKETVAEIQKYPIADPKERNIPKWVCEKYGVRMAVSEADGKTPVAYYFPYYDQKGKLTGYKKRDLTIEKYEKGHFLAIGKVSVDCKLFGQDVAEKVKRKRNNLYTCEGEWDILSTYTAMVESVKGTSYEGMEPFVVGLSCGTANAVDACLSNEEFISSFAKFTLALDNDSATAKERAKGIKRGLEATEDIASAFMGDNLYTITYEEDMKDASDYLQANKGAELAKLMQFGAKRFVAEKIAYASDISFEELIEKRQEGLYVKSFPKLMEKIRGFRKRELVLLTAPSGVGKSLITSIFANDFIEAKERVGCIYLEETKKETLQRMVAQQLKVNYNKFRNDPLSVAEEYKVLEAYNKIVEDDKLVLLDHFGNLPISELMNKIKHMHYVSKCSYIIVDHLTLCVSGSGKDIDERQQLDTVMTELASFCAANDVCIIAVSHINRAGSADNKPPKDADEKPYWVKIDKSHMRGSAALEQLSWIILGLENEIKPDRSRGNVRITVMKNRPWSYLGVADEFTMDDTTWEIILQNDVQEF